MCPVLLLPGAAKLNQIKLLCSTPTLDFRLALQGFAFCCKFFRIQNLQGFMRASVASAPTCLMRLKSCRDIFGNAGIDTLVFTEE